MEDKYLPTIDIPKSHGSRTDVASDVNDRVTYSHDGRISRPRYRACWILEKATVESRAIQVVDQNGACAVVGAPGQTEGRLSSVGGKKKCGSCKKKEMQEAQSSFDEVAGSS